MYGINTATRPPRFGRVTVSDLTHLGSSKWVRQRGAFTQMYY
jgi:hypothetical protein